MCTSGPALPPAPPPSPHTHTHTRTHRRWAPWQYLITSKRREATSAELQGILHYNNASWRYLIPSKRREGTSAVQQGILAVHKASWRYRSQARGGKTPVTKREEGRTARHLGSTTRHLGGTWYQARGGKALRQCSSRCRRPPGFKTRPISRTAATGDGNTHRLNVSTTLSNWPSSKGIPLTSPTEQPRTAAPLGTGPRFCLVPLFVGIPVQSFV
jgi:hypothetical protein